MGGYVLDFERPIVELENKIEELSALVGTSPEVEKEIKSLQKTLDKLRKEVFSKLTPWQRVLLARHPDRPYTLNFIHYMVEDFLELYGDRLFADDPAIVTGVGKIDGRSVVIVGHEKGRTTKEKIHRNFGMPHPEGYRKALRVMRMAARFKKPILCLIDTPGAFPGIGAEERGQAEAIAENIKAMAVLPVPIVVVITGEGGSGGALAIGVGDRVYILENAVYSVISPEGCASILWRDATKASEAAAALKITAKDLLRLGVVDRVLPEPSGGAHRDHRATSEIIKTAVIEAFDELAQLSPEELIRKRIDKFCAMGVYEE